MTDKALPKPQCEFEFDLPRGVDADDDPILFPPDETSFDARQYFNIVGESNKHGSNLDSVPPILPRSQLPLSCEAFSARIPEDSGSSSNMLEPSVCTSSRKSAKKGRHRKGLLSQTEVHDSDDDQMDVNGKASIQFHSLFGESKQNDVEGPTVQSKPKVNPLNGSGISWQETQQHPSIRTQRQERFDNEVLDNCTYSHGFRDDISLSGNESPVPSERSSIPATDHQGVYEFRQNVNRKVASTYVDTDRSGNFDPVKEAHMRRAKTTRMRPADSKSRKGQGKAPGSVEKQNVKKCIVRLPIDAIGSLRNITNDEDNWPDGWSDLDPECEREREIWRTMYRHSTPGYERQDPVPDPADIVDDLTGHPAARGCRSCRELKQDCSTIDTGIYPCERCERNGQTCHLIIEPSKKGKCQQCLNEGAPYCSMQEDPNEMICQSCEDNNKPCDPLPPHGYKVERISLNEILYGPKRPFRECTYCRQHKIKCSLQRKSTRPPCKHCRQHDFGCTFYDLDYLEELKQAEQAPQEPPVSMENLLETIAPDIMRPNADMFSPTDLADLRDSDHDDAPTASRDLTPEEDWIDDAYGNVGTYTKLSTSFAHPIHFNVSAFTTADCSFCAMPYFSFVGHYEREVHALRWQNGKGYTELAAGHGEQNGPTSMCLECVLSRAYTVACPSHHLEYQYGNSEPPTFDEVFEKLLEARGADQVREQLQHWCSICFHPAAYRCCTQRSSLFDVQESGIEGCGLLLCLHCEVSFRKNFGGDLDAMATAMELEPKIKEGEELNGHSTRADVGFLMSDGLLMRALDYERNNDAMAE